mmetsp:Transcript_107186/g.230869  ORF Transcript_107186/g.230869 Transcript_107186/m.230869 type:complete len:271 (+) Transcript_107186:400-1212(+)
MHAAIWSRAFGERPYCASRIVGGTWKAIVLRGKASLTQCRASGTSLWHHSRMSSAAACTGWAPRRDRGLPRRCHHFARSQRALSSSTRSGSACPKLLLAANLGMTSRTSVSLRSCPLMRAPHLPLLSGHQYGGSPVPSNWQKPRSNPWTEHTWHPLWLFHVPCDRSMLLMSTPATRQKSVMAFLLSEAPSMSTERPAKARSILCTLSVPISLWKGVSPSVCQFLTGTQYGCSEPSGKQRPQDRLQRVCMSSEAALRLHSPAAAHSAQAGF